MLVQNLIAASHCGTLFLFLDILAEYNLFWHIFSIVLEVKHQAASYYGEVDVLEVTVALQCSGAAFSSCSVLQTALHFTQMLVEYSQVFD